jgi:hypothetical protein
MRARVLGVALKPGDTGLPIAGYWSSNGSPWEQFFHNCGANVDPGKAVLERISGPGEQLNFGARQQEAEWQPHHTTGHRGTGVTVLLNGDLPPTRSSANDRKGLAAFLFPYLGESGRLELGPCELILLWNCSTCEPGHPCRDMQGLVVLLSFEEFSGSAEAGNRNHMSRPAAARPDRHIQPQFQAQGRS